MLCGETIDASALSEQSDTLRSIGNSLTPGGDILLYGCSVAEGQEDQDFIEKLAQYNGADVAASTNMTGTATKGGDWVLEASTERIDTLWQAAQEAKTNVGNVYFLVAGRSMGVPPPGLRSRPSSRRRRPTSRPCSSALAAGRLGDWTSS